MRAFGLTTIASSSQPAPIMRVSPKLVVQLSPSSVCTQLATLLVSLVGSDPDRLRPPSEEFSPFGQDRMTAGRYVAVASSTWRNNYRGAIRQLYNGAGGIASVQALNDCLVAKLVEITDLTKATLIGHLNVDVAAQTGTTTTGTTTGRTAGEKTADKEQSITKGQEDVWMPPVDTCPSGTVGVPPNCVQVQAQPPVTCPPGQILYDDGTCHDDFPGCPSGQVHRPDGLCVPDGLAKPFPWVPVLAGVAVVGGIGLVLLVKKKKRK